MWNALDMGTSCEDDFLENTPPQLIFSDVDLGIPYDDDSFDFVYSNMSFFFFREKALVLQEINRVLRPGGVARIDIRKVERPDLPVQFFSLFEIWEGNNLVPFLDYLGRYSNIKTGVARCGPYLELHKTDKLEFNLKLVGSLDINLVSESWGRGNRSTYVVR